MHYNPCMNINKYYILKLLKCHKIKKILFVLRLSGRNLRVLLRSKSIMMVNSFTVMYTVCKTIRYTYVTK